MRAPLRRGRERLQPHLEEPRGAVPRRVAWRGAAAAIPAPAAAVAAGAAAAAAAGAGQARARRIQQVRGGLDQVHLRAVREQQLLRHAPHARAGVCRGGLNEYQVAGVLLKTSGSSAAERCHIRARSGKPATLSLPLQQASSPA